MWVFMNFQKTTCEPARKAEKPSPVRSISQNNIQAHRVVIVSSIITKIFNPSKYWTVTTQPLLEQHSSDQCLYCIASFYCSIFVCFVVLFDSVLCSYSSLFSIQIIQCIFCPDPGNVFQVFRSRYTPIIKQSINIIQQTAPFFVLV